VATTNECITSAKVFFDRLKGEKCWTVIAGPGSGSMAKLAFGAKIKRDRKIRNEKLTDEQREFTGEFVLFIMNTFWEIGNSKEKICNNEDSNDEDGLMLSGLNQLIGKYLISIDFLNGFCEFRLNFNDGLYLKLKSDANLDIDNNYSLSYMGTTINLGLPH
jgi:hypothetical protein